jgi:hypothetical protein
MIYYPQLPRESFRLLRGSWFTYVDVERKKDGMGWDGICQRDDVATAGRVEPPTPTGLPRVKPRHSTNSTVSWGSHTVTDYILHGFPLGKDHTRNVDGTAPNDDILGAEQLPYTEMVSSIRRPESKSS